MKNNLITASILILIAVISRIVPHGWNFTALGAVAITAGFLISNRTLVFITILSSLLISDAVIGFHNTMMTVYFGYAAMALVGIFMSETKNIKSILNSGLIGSILFFIISNLGVWFEGQLYPMTYLGLINCFEMAVPFFRNELISTLIIAPVLFYGFRQFEAYQTGTLTNK